MGGGRTMVLCIGPRVTEAHRLRFTLKLMRRSEGIAVLVALVALSGCAQGNTSAVNASPTPLSTQSPATTASPRQLPSEQPPPPSPLPPPSLAPNPSPSVPGAGPRPRANAAWAFDASSGKFVLFGGNYTTGNYHEFPQALGDTWAWDGSTWSEVLPSSPGPVARYSAGSTYDPVHRTLVLHAGNTSTGVVNDTWTWNGTRWNLMNPDVSPPSPGNTLSYEPMCWDAPQRRVLLFDWTGATYQTELNQTWAWDGTNWAQLTTSGTPSGHSFWPANMACHSATRSAVFSGRMSNGTPTTWTFDGTSWVRTTSTSGTASISFIMAPDEAHSVVVLFGQNGDTWTWDGTRWTPQNPNHAPPARRGAAIAYDSVHHQVVLFGGSTGDAADLRELNDIWTWNGTDWTKVA